MVKYCLSFQKLFSYGEFLAKHIAFFFLFLKTWVALNIIIILLSLKDKRIK